MKKLAKILALVFVAVMLFAMVACGNKYEPYEGYQFAGTNPWGEQLAITIRTIKDGKMEWTYTDIAGDLTLYEEVTGTTLKDMTADFTVKGDANDITKFTYSGTLTMKDGKLIVTYTAGNIEVFSTEGGSTARMIEAVPEAERTITLERVILDK